MPGPPIGPDVSSVYMTFWWSRRSSFGRWGRMQDPLRAGPQEGVAHEPVTFY